MIMDHFAENLSDMQATFGLATPGTAVETTVPECAGQGQDSGRSKSGNGRTVRTDGDILSNMDAAMKEILFS
jgi:hypothetical protein